MLSDVYSPTIENSNDATLQYVVTDGSSFTALQQRDMTYTVSSPDPSGMVCEVTSTDAAHGFKLVSDYLTDPGRDSVIMQTRLLPLAGGSVAGLKVYARWDATIDNTGGGGAKNQGANDATIDPATTALVASDTQAPAGPFAAQVTGAVLASRPFLAASSGFADTPSDGLAQLDAHHRLVNQYRTASDGNVVQTAEVDSTPGGGPAPFTLASPTDPWGQSVPATTTHPGWTYREIFARDSYETFTGLLADGDVTSARAMVRFLFDRTQQADGSFPRNSLIDGAVAPDTFGLFEIDELRLIVVRSRLAVGRGAHRKRTFVTLASSAPGHTA